MSRAGATCSVLRHLFPGILAVAGLAVLGQGAAAQQTAALPAQRSVTAEAGRPAAGMPLRVSTPRSLGDALMALHRTDAALSRGPDAAERAFYRSQLEAAAGFARSLDGGASALNQYQWHRVDRAVVAGGARRVLLRPLTGLKCTSAVTLEIEQGAAMVDHVWIHGAGGKVFRFSPRKALNPVERRSEVFLLDREIELTAVEVFYRADAAPGAMRPALAAKGGISTVRPYGSECALQLLLARDRMDRGAYAQARAHVRGAVALLNTFRRPRSL